MKELDKKNYKAECWKRYYELVGKNYNEIGE